MSQDPAEDDGQLHTLGLLEELRRECSLHWNTSSDLYGKIDSALRKLANPNLHDIANMSFRVELWDQHANHVRWVVAQRVRSPSGTRLSMRPSPTGRTNASRCGKASCSSANIPIAGSDDVPLAGRWSLA